jgi:hypothetical protein
MPTAELRAAEKQKRDNRMKCRLCYKQATPPGFVRASYQEVLGGQGRWWVMTICGYMAIIATRSLRKSFRFTLFKSGSIFSGGFTVAQRAYTVNE